MPQTKAQRQGARAAQTVSPRGSWVDVDVLLAPLWESLEADSGILGRYESDGTATLLIDWRRDGVAGRLAAAAATGANNLVMMVAETGRPARIDDRTGASGDIGEALSRAGNHGGVGTPIVIKGNLWGVLAAVSLSEGGLPADTQSRIAGVAQLVAVAIANAEDVAALDREQSAVRRIATLVAHAVPEQELFEAVTEEVGQLLSAERAMLGRYEADATVTCLAAWQTGGGDVPFPKRLALGGRNLATMVSQTGRPARMDSYDNASGPIGVAVRDAGHRAGVAAPIVVDSRMWGVVQVGFQVQRPPPADAEQRLSSFTELVATALANSESRAAQARLAAEQASLRRVATLIAQGVAQEELFRAVTEEAGRLLGVASVHLARYEPDDAATVLGAWGAEQLLLEVGMRMPLGGHNITTLVAETGRSASVDAYGEPVHPINELAAARGVQAAVGEPIIVDARVWGLLVALTDGEHSLPQDAAQRLASFTELVATAIANAESRASQARLADEQAALRRVATLVAQGVAEEQLFATVTQEAGRLLDVTWVHLGRYNPDDTTTAVGAWGTAPVLIDVGTTLPLGGNNLATIIAQTAAAARLDAGGQTDSELDRRWRLGGIESALGEPILVEGGLWGWISAATAVGTPLPARTAERLASFAELVATAIANAEGRGELNASRARIVAAADEARQRIERDLHDGAQQHLVHTVIGLKLALRGLRNGDAGAERLVADALGHAEDATADLRELAHGILPTVLTSGGLRAGAQSLVSRLSLPVRMEATDRRFPAAIEATGYFVMSEALTNVVKHAHATRATVTAEVEGGQLKVEVADDGVGGARAGRTSGLGGLKDRVAAMGGRLEVVSSPGRGTAVRAWLPAAPPP